MKVPRKNKTHIDYILDDYPLDPYEFRVMCRIVRREGNGSVLFESVPNMAEKLSINHHRVRLALKCLEAYGLVKSKERKGQTTEYQSVEKVTKWLEPKKVEAKRQEITQVKKKAKTAKPLQHYEGVKNSEPLRIIEGEPLRIIEDEVLHISKTKQKTIIKQTLATDEEATLETTPQKQYKPIPLPETVKQFLKTKELN